jgi:hypothetical protein
MVENRSFREGGGGGFGEKLNEEFFPDVAKGNTFAKYEY